MNKVIDKPAVATAVQPDGLALLRHPFPDHQVSKLPKPTAAQTKAVRDDYKSGVRCQICGAWHHPKVVHLDYVGHAALTDRLLDCDPAWNWEPVALGPDGTPLRDSNGGMWIRLTVCGITRLGYGHPDGKTGGDAVKEVIGDALRNAAMRFGAALDLWHKGQLHIPDDDAPTSAPEAPKAQDHIDYPSGTAPADIAISSLNEAASLDALSAIWRDLPRAIQAMPEVLGAKDNRKAALTTPVDDEIPY